MQEDGSQKTLKGRDVWNSGNQIGSKQCTAYE